MRNIAPQATATQSSYSKWSYSGSETGNVLTGYAPNGYSFHTLLEKEPWIQIDLKKIYPICGIKIFPRINYSHNYCPCLEVLSSIDGYHFEKIYENDNAFKNDKYHCLFFRLDNIHSRFLIFKSKNCYFSLTQVEIFIDDSVMAFRNVNILRNRFHSQSITNSILEGRYERNEIDIVLDSASKNDIVLETGANIGIMACCVLKNINPKRYYAIEANPYLIPEIQKNLKLNSLKCHIHNCVLTIDDVYEADFYVSDNILASSLSKLNKFRSKIKVNCKNINEFMCKYKISYWICDIEGGEYLLISDELNLQYVKKICLELHPADSVLQLKLLQTLKEKGFNTNSNYNPESVSVLYFYRE